MKKNLSLSVLALIGVLLLGSCNQNTIKVNPNKKTYHVGITQLVRHPALDAATEGFKDSLKDELAKIGRDVRFSDTNSQGETSLCVTSVEALIFRDVDLIMANATAAFQAAASCTRNIPVLGTSITSYEVALGRKIKDNIIGTNASGTTDLAPLKEQAQMIFDIVPQAKTIGILYCSSEANSIYQVEEMEKHIKSINETVDVKRFSFVDSNDVDSVSRSAAGQCDAIYTPTDNTVASSSMTIANATAHGKNGKRTPIICGDEGTCSNAGVATLTINYYDLGATTGLMAADILLGKKDIRKMAIQPANKAKKKYNEKMVKESDLDINIFKDYDEKI